MKKTSVLAKILFLFFAVISLGLVTVSCSDEDDDCSCDTEVKERGVSVEGSLIFDESSKELILIEYPMPGINVIVYNICNTKTVKDFYYTHKNDMNTNEPLPVTCSVDIKSECDSRVDETLEKVEYKKINVKSIELR